MTRRSSEQFERGPSKPASGFMPRIEPLSTHNTPDEIARVRDLISHQPDAHDLAQILGIPLDI